MVLVLHLGVWGLTCVRVTLLLASATVCNRLQPFATVCNRLQPFATVCNRLSASAKLPCLWEKSQKRHFFDVSEAVLMSFCVAGVALRGIPTCFTTHQKIVLCGRCNTFATCSEDVLHFRGRRSTLDTSDVILRGRRSTLDVSCCVFSVNRIVSAVQSGDKVQIPWNVMVKSTSFHSSPKTSKNATTILMLAKSYFSQLNPPINPHFSW